jgi:Tfp pilus assembly protein PilO
MRRSPGPDRIGASLCNAVFVILYDTLFIMPPARHEIIYSLITIVFVLLVGIAGLLRVAYKRHQHLADQTLELRNSLDQQNSQISNLKERLEKCDSLESRLGNDTSWSPSPTTAAW